MGVVITFYILVFLYKTNVRGPFYPVRLSLPESAFYHYLHLAVAAIVAAGAAGFPAPFHAQRPIGLAAGLQQQRYLQFLFEFRSQFPWFDTYLPEDYSL